MWSNVFTAVRRHLFGPRAPPVATVLPAPLLVFVEGRHDIEFLPRIATIVHAARPDLPDLAREERDGRLIFLPIGGSDDRLWLARLADLGCPEFHLFDRDAPHDSARRERSAAVVIRRAGCRAFVTGRRSLENYLHPDAIYEARGVRVAFGADDDVAECVARAACGMLAGDAWRSASRKTRRRHRDRAKTWLNTDAVARMTVARLAAQDPHGGVVAWLVAMRTLLGSENTILERGRAGPVP